VRTLIGLQWFASAERNSVLGVGIPLFQKAKEFAGLSWSRAYLDKE
jgi:hypothetical protein